MQRAEKDNYLTITADPIAAYRLMRPMAARGCAETEHSPSNIHVQGRRVGKNNYLAQRGNREHRRIARALDMKTDTDLQSTSCPESEA